MLEQVSAGDLVRVTEARSLAESLIPRLEEDAAAVLAMAAARRPSERQLYHSLNVMCYSLLLGHRLGLPAEGLSSLGTAALLHDIGKSAFDPDDPAQAEPMRLEHPRVGAEMLQRLALDDVSPDARRLRAPHVRERVRASPSARRATSRTRTAAS